ncbi:MAG: sugar ABC transporter permease [Spirochaetaceae bacterium]|nr:sugar ABC transporter permease [Spirochaetaceae bacterium]
MSRRNPADHSRTTVKRPPLKLNRDTKGYFFILPYFLVLIALQLYPIIFTMGLSFTKPINMFENEFAGLENYRRLLTNPIFYQSIFNTLWIWLWNYIPQIIFAVLLAVILTTYKLKGREFLRTVYFLPNLVTAASIGVLFAVILDWKNGALNHVLVSMGILNEPFQWTVRPRIMQGAVSFIQWWQWFGYTMIIMMAGLNAISEDLYEAAHIDGASRKQAFFGVTLPLLRPTMLYVMITSLIGGMQIFDIPKVITRGRGQPDGALNTMVLYLYNQAFQNFNVGYAAAIAWVLFFIILIFSILSFRLIKGRD